MQQNKRILVTGGAGFVGSHLCDKLIGLGFDVTALDNLMCGSQHNLLQAKTCKLFKFVQADVKDPIVGEYDWIFNLACPASPPIYQRDPIDTAKVNFFGALHCLELAKNTGARVFQASTSEVYGDPELTPQPESYRGNVNPHGPRACYDEGKRIAESLFFDFHRTYGTDIKVARIFNTYGPRMDRNDGRVVSNFIVQALLNESITIYGDGKQSRSFCFVDDLVDGFIRLMGSDATLQGPVNMGNPVEFSMIELAELVLELTGSRSSMIRLPLPIDDPKHRCPDITQAKEKLGWEPKVHLRDGLIRTIAYFDTLLSKQAA
jgi:UDP-glucuronate decarboxylase